MFPNIVEKTIKTYNFFLPAISLSSAYNLIKISWLSFPVCFSFYKTYIKLQFYFSFRLLFKYFAIRVFFTLAWDFISVFLTRVKSDWREILLGLERVDNIRSLCGDRSEFTSLHCGLPCQSEIIICVTSPLRLEKNENWKK